MHNIEKIDSHGGRAGILENKIGTAHNWEGLGG
jgi:hypothetical protein